MNDQNDIMDVDMAAPAGGTLAHILCCLCGIPIRPNHVNMCVACLSSQSDLANVLPRVPTPLPFCKFCGRYLAAPPRGWVSAELESRELLALLLKRLARPLSRVKLVDAKFLWTEPHSRRIVVQLTLQSEVLNGTIIEQEARVEFRVEYLQCDACTREAANMDAWVCVVQVRQRADHKRTFFYLEQLILKHKMHMEALGMKNVGADGIDFFFGSKSTGQRFLDFVAKSVPVCPGHNKASELLVTHDAHNNSYRYKYTFVAQIAPVCRDDLVCLPPKLHASCGRIGPIVLVSRLAQGFAFVDPNTAETAELPNSAYWNRGQPSFTPLLTTRRLVEFTVLDVEVDDASARQRSRYVLADVTVTRSSDLGVTDRLLYLRSHLGAVLQPGDLCMGYDVSGANFNEDYTSQYRGLELPDVVLVEKTYPKRRARRWKLKTLDADAPADADANDREAFMQELERDPEMRAQVNMYKDSDAKSVADTATDAGGEYPEVPLSELLDDLNLEDGPDQG